MSSSIFHIFIVLSEEPEKILVPSNEKTTVFTPFSWVDVVGFIVEERCPFNWRFRSGAWAAPSGPVCQPGLSGVQLCLR